jgi:hypothetical protein
VTVAVYARLTCPVCACTADDPAGAEIPEPGREQFSEGVAIGGELGLILAEGWGMPKRDDCPGCTCHTGVGVLPQHLQVYVAAAP